MNDRVAIFMDDDISLKDILDRIHLYIVKLANNCFDALAELSQRQYVSMRNTPVYNKF